jgi:hypothetical protein
MTCLKFEVLFFCGAPSLTRGRVCNLQCNHSMVRVVQNRKHTLMSHLRLPQPGGPGPRIYIRQEQGGRVIPPGTGLPKLKGQVPLFISP